MLVNSISRRNLKLTGLASSLLSAMSGKEYLMLNDS